MGSVSSLILTLCVTSTPTTHGILTSLSASPLALLVCYLPRSQSWSFEIISLIISFPYWKLSSLTYYQVLLICVFIQPLNASSYTRVSPCSRRHSGSVRFTCSNPFPVVSKCPHGFSTCLQESWWAQDCMHTVCFRSSVTICSRRPWGLLFSSMSGLWSSTTSADVTFLTILSKIVPTAVLYLLTQLYFYKHFILSVFILHINLSLLF